MVRVDNLIRGYHAVHAVLTGQVRHLFIIVLFEALISFL